MTFHEHHNETPPPEKMLVPAQLALGSEAVAAGGGLRAGVGDGVAAEDSVQPPPAAGGQGGGGQDRGQGRGRGQQGDEGAAQKPKQY